MVGERLFQRKTIRLKKEFLKREVLQWLTWSKLSELERLWDELFEEKVTKEEISRSKRLCLPLKKKTRSFSSIQ
jgi:hypothetical protein